MKRETVKKFVPKKKERIDYMVTQRLDESLPLHTAEWVTVEQKLMRLYEFAPAELVVELVDAMAIWADYQARRGYLLGQEDLVKEIKERLAA